MYHVNRRDGMRAAGVEAAVEMEEKSRPSVHFVNAHFVVAGGRTGLCPPSESVFLGSDSSMGAGGAPAAGDPKERWGAAARSMATNYKVSCQAKREITETPHRR